MTEIVIREISSHGVAKITLNHPQALNCLDLKTILDLHSHFNAAVQDTSVRAIIICAIGKMFCTGIDLKLLELVFHSAEENTTFSHALSQLLKTIYRSPKPVIVLVEGPAYGPGVGIIAACDIALATENSYFCCQEVRQGLIAGESIPYILEAIGARQARRYLLSGERLSAQDALRLGLIHQITGQAELEATTETLIHNILKGEPGCLTATKELTQLASTKTISDDFIHATVNWTSKLRITPQAMEGIKAYLEQKSPSWCESEDENE